MGSPRSCGVCHGVPVEFGGEAAEFLLSFIQCFRWSQCKGIEEAKVTPHSDGVLGTIHQ